MVQHGKGRQIWADGSEYDGMWVNGLQQGFGVQQWPESNLSYTGEWLQGLKSGKGEQKWNDGSNYNGEWKND